MQPQKRILFVVQTNGSIPLCHSKSKLALRRRSIQTVSQTTKGYDDWSTRVLHQAFATFTTLRVLRRRHEAATQALT